MRRAGVVLMVMIGLLLAACGSNTAKPVPATGPHHDTLHVIADLRPGVSDATVSRFTGTAFMGSADLARYDLHDCNIGSPAVLLCTFRPGATTSDVTRLAQYLRGSQLFTQVRVAYPAATSG